jgi:hypothetical protein
VAHEQHVVSVALTLCPLGLLRPQTGNLLNAVSTFALRLITALNVLLDCK